MRRSLRLTAFVIRNIWITFGRTIIYILLNDKKNIYISSVNMRWPIASDGVEWDLRLRVFVEATLFGVVAAAVRHLTIVDVVFAAAITFYDAHNNQQ